MRGRRRWRRCGCRRRSRRCDLCRRRGLLGGNPRPGSAWVRGGRGPTLPPGSTVGRAGPRPPHSRGGGSADPKRCDERAAEQPGPRDGESPADGPGSGTLWWVGGLGEELAELGDDVALGHGADEAFLFYAADEEGEGGDAHDAVAHGDLGVLVDVELGDGDLALVLLGDLLEHRGDHLARSAPLGPEVDQHGGARLEHLAVERGVGHGCGFGHSSGASSDSDPRPSATTPGHDLFLARRWCCAITPSCRWWPRSRGRGPPASARRRWRPRSPCPPRSPPAGRRGRPRRRRRTPRPRWWRSMVVGG